MPTPTTLPRCPVPQAIIFDMDGLLIDSERLYFEADRAVAAEAGKTVSDQTLWKLMGRKPLDSMALFKAEVGLPGTPEEIMARREEIFFAMLQRDLVPMPGMYEILNAFRGRVKLAVATGSPTRFLNPVMDQLRLRGYFAVLQPSDEVQLGKPHPEIYLRTAAKLGVPPTACVVLEDSTNGSRSAKDAGCYVIAVPSDYTRGQDFSFVDFVAGDLFHAREHIEGLLNGRLPSAGATV